MGYEELEESQRELEANDKLLDPVIEECKTCLKAINEIIAYATDPDELAVDRLYLMEDLECELPRLQDKILKLQKILTARAPIESEVNEAEDAIPYEDPEKDIRWDYRIAQGY